MTRSSELKTNWIAGCLAVFLVFPFGQVVAAQQSASPAKQNPPSQQAQSTSSTENQLQNPDAQGASQDEQSGMTQQQDNTTKPLGTAAAPVEKPTGVAASRPAGAVIAPAKQRRVRSILIKVGIVVGAGVAIGTVAALSHGSPSQPH